MSRTITRKDKKGNKYEFETYCCGSCAKYHFEDKDEKNKCSEYRRYYYEDDSCREWEEADDEYGGCFLTTACCYYHNLPDNCIELDLLRQFRDERLKYMTGGPDAIAEYYRVAPGIVQTINSMDEIKKKQILDYIYDVINNICHELIRNDCDYYVVFNEYKSMYQNVKKMTS